MHGERWHFFEVKNVFALLRRIASKRDFYYLNCLYLVRTKNKFLLTKKVCENKDFCGSLMPSENIAILELNQNQNFHKTPSIIYAYLESLIRK